MWLSFVSLSCRNKADFLELWHVEYLHTKWCSCTPESTLELPNNYAFLLDVFSSSPKAITFVSHVFCPMWLMSSIKTQHFVFWFVYMPYSSSLTDECDVTSHKLIEFFICHLLADTDYGPGKQHLGCFVDVLLFIPALDYNNVTNIKIFLYCKFLQSLQSSSHHTKYKGSPTTYTFWGILGHLLSHGSILNYQDVKKLPQICSPAST